MQTRQKILLIDQHPEWLTFAQEVLSKDYDVVALSKHEDIFLLRDKAVKKGFDLIFIGLELATGNLDQLKPLFKEWHFVVIFPVLQENETVRLLFKAGVYDCARKPYEREGLLKLVAEELVVAKIANGQDKISSSPKTHQESINQLAAMLNLEDKDHDNKKDTPPRR